MQLEYTIKTEMCQSLGTDTKQKLQEAKDFYNDRIKGWMINDLKTCNNAQANFLTALGCLIYTEIIGIFLPPLPRERGSKEERRFYRCLFRLKSREYLMGVDKELLKITPKGIYGHLRHSMTHTYYPHVKLRKNGITLFLSSMVARHGVTVDIPTGIRVKSPPIGFSNDGSQIIIANTNYIDELEEAVNNFYDLTFNQQVCEFVEAIINGVDIVLRGKE